MIKAQDLRCNNWIKTVNGYEQVVDVLCDSVNTKTLQNELYDNIRPIELTPELLGKILNCEKVKGREGIYRMGNLQLLCNTDGKALLYIHYDDGKYCYVREINHLHQLQNAAL